MAEGGEEDRLRERGRLREGAGCGLRSGCVGLISRSSVPAGREGECRYLFNLVCARPFGLGPYNYIGCTDWPNSLVCSSRKGQTPFSACVSSARHRIEAQYDWGNVCSISVRSFLWYSFDHLAWVAPVDGQLALVATWPRSAIRLGKCWQHFHS